MMRSSILIFGALLICGTTVRALSRPPVHLTPKNIDDQPHKLAVTANDSGLATTALGEKGTRVFRVSVATKDPKVPLEIEGGYLHLLDGARVVCRCAIRGRQDKAEIVFEFEVATAYLEKSSFGFSVANSTLEERKKLPAGGGWVGYEVNLKNFAPAPESRGDPK
jgi:hypothetical protein